MKCAVFLGFLALATAQVQVRLAFNSPAGVTLTGAGHEPTFQIQNFQAQQQQTAEQQQADQQQQQQAVDQYNAAVQQQQAQQQQADQQQQQQAADQYNAAVQQQQAQQQQADQQQQQLAVNQYNAAVQQQQNQQQQADQQQQAVDQYNAAIQQQQGQQQQAQQQQAEQQQAADQQAQAYAAQQQQAQALSADQQEVHPALPAYAPPPSVPYTAGHAAAAVPLAYQAAHAPALAYSHAAVAAPAYAHAPALAYSHAPVAKVAAAPALAYHQKIGYAATPVLTKVQGVADVPVTKLAYSHGVTQKLVDVAHPAVTTRKVKVRRPALRKEFYDIEHRVIVRPAGSATLELSQPISKEQKGPTVLTPTKFVHTAPVVRYGTSRQIVDGEGVPVPELQRSAQAPSPRAGPSAAPAPAPQPEQQQQQPQLRSGPAPQRQSPQQQPAAAPRDADTDVVSSADEPAAPQQQGPAPQQPQGPPQQPQEEQPAPPPQGRDLITPNMPAELQKRLLELLSNQGGTVTEVLNEDGRPANSASVLQVADALGDPQLQGGERITTRRIVVTRPIETIQEIEVQEPATKIQRVAVNQPTLFKHAIPAVARVPVAVPAVKHVATPVLKTYAQPAYAQPAYAHQAYAQPAYAAYAGHPGYVHH